MSDTRLYVEFRLQTAPESARGNLLINPFFPWSVFLAFVLAGETLRVRAKRIAQSNARTLPGP
jgi:hypothetical protein